MIKNDFEKLTVLLGVFTAQDGQTFSDSGSDHERISSTESMFIRLGQGEFFKVQTQLAHIGLFFDGHLASVGAVLSTRIAGVHKNSFILTCCAATGEFEWATTTVSVCTFTDRLTRSSQTVRFRQAGTAFAIVDRASGVLKTNDRQKTWNNEKTKKHLKKKLGIQAMVNGFKDVPGKETGRSWACESPLKPSRTRDSATNRIWKSEIWNQKIFKCKQKSEKISLDVPLWNV